MIQRLQGQTFPAKRRSENKRNRKGKKKGKNTVYILATHGPLSHFAASNGYIPSQHSAKPTPSRVVFLSASPGTPLVLPSIRKVLRCLPHCRDTATKLGYNLLNVAFTRIWSQACIIDRRHIHTPSHPPTHPPTHTHIRTHTRCDEAPSFPYKALAVDEKWFYS